VGALAFLPRIAGAQALNTFYSFSGGDGWGPLAGLIQASDGNLYGTTSAGGTYSNGTVFKITTGGVFTSLYSFTGGSDGSTPSAALYQASDGNLYGTTTWGGDNGNGTVFMITTGGAFTTLYSFTGGSDGANPVAPLVQASDGALYGTCQSGGSGSGTIYKITTAGVFSLVYTFSGGDGKYPTAGLTLASDGALYGVTSQGGWGASGVIFRVKTDGTFTVLHVMDYSADGGLVYGNLIQATDGNLYGMANTGGATSLGTVFQIDTSGNFINDYSFSDTGDGGSPLASLLQASDGNFYGTVSEYPGATGAVVEVWPVQGWDSILAPIYGDSTFTPSNLIQANDGLAYFITQGGGANGKGAIYQFYLPAHPATLTFNPGTVVSGQSTTATVTLNNQAPPGGAYVHVFGYGNVNSVYFTIPQGQTTGTVTVSTTASLTGSTAQVFAQYNFTNAIAYLDSTPGLFKVTPSAGSGGAVSPGTAQTVAYGGSITFTATPNPGYGVATWTVDGTTAQTGGTSFTLSNVTAAHSVNVTFTSLSNYTVYSGYGANGTVSPAGSQSVPGGGSITFTATPNTGYAVSQWFLDGTAAQSGGATYTLSNVAANHTVGVTFAVQTFTITPSAGANGSISPSAAQTVKYGGSVTLTATPGANYVVDTWYVDGTAVATGTKTYKLSNVTADHTVNVTFKAVQFAVTASAGVGGTVSPSGAQSVSYGSSISFTASPNAGYTVSTWSVDGTVAQTGGTSFTLSNVTAKHTVQVKFVKITYTVTASAGTGGTISPAGTSTVTTGGSLSFKATPSTGYVVGVWQVDGTTAQTGGTIFKLANVTANHTVTVSFSLQTLTVTASAGAGGTVSPSGAQSVSYGGSVSFTGTPNSGYTVSTWSVDGKVVQTGGTGFTLSNVTANHTVQVKFVKLTYTVTASASAGGTISPAGTSTVNPGASLKFTAKPSTGFLVSVWQVDGVTVQTGGTSFTLSNITANHTVMVIYN
jgi:uncharacterized repeat protein (TIGR03803 family)